MAEANFGSHRGREKKRESGGRKRVREHMANNYSKKEEPIKNTYICTCMHACVYVCMFGVQPADPVTFLLLLQTNVATTKTRVRDDRRHFLRCLSTESGRYEERVRELEIGF